jgi:hypothetical protein
MAGTTNTQRESTPTEARETYTFVGLIDSASLADLGSNHRGIYVVRRPSDGRLLVEKRLPFAPEWLNDPYAPPTDEPLANEIRVLRKLRHPYIVEYVDAFVRRPAQAVGNDGGATSDNQNNNNNNNTSTTTTTTTGSEARLYTEYCSLGGLEDLTGRMENECTRLRRDEHVPFTRDDSAAAAAGAPRVPEAFVWHVFISMARVLYYLATGRREAYGARRRAGWQSLVHLDVATRNVFLRERAARQGQRRRRRQKQQPRRPQQQQRTGANTTGSTAAAAATAIDPNAEADAIARAAAAAGYPDPVLGDWGLAVPVVDQRPYAEQFGAPVPPQTEQRADGRRDVVQLAECMTNLCTNSLRPNLTPPRPRPGTAAAAAASSDNAGAGYGSTYYSRELVAAINAAARAEQDPQLDAYQLLRLLVRQYRRAGPLAFEPLPAWAAAKQRGGRPLYSTSNSARRAYHDGEASDADHSRQQSVQVVNSTGGGDGGAQGSPEDWGSSSSSSSGSDEDSDDGNDERRRRGRPIGEAEARALSALIANRTLRLPGDRARGGCDRCSVNVMVKFRDSDFGQIDVFENTIEGFHAALSASTATPT